MKKVLILDTETTGLSNHPIHGHPQVIELAYWEAPELAELKRMFLSAPIEELYKSLNNMFLERYRPSMEIDKKATEVHGIKYSALLDKKRSDFVIKDLPYLEDIQYIIGHNIQYDIRCLGRLDIKSICTLALSKSINKNFSLGFENNKLDYLAEYFYPLYIKYFTTTFHSARLDVIKTIFILVKFLHYLPGVTIWEELYNFQSNIKKISK